MSHPPPPDAAPCSAQTGESNKPPNRGRYSPYIGTPHLPLNIPTQILPDFHSRQTLTFISSGRATPHPQKLKIFPTIPPQKPTFSNLNAQTWSQTRTTTGNREDSLCASTIRPASANPRATGRHNGPRRATIPRAGAKRSQLFPPLVAFLATWLLGYLAFAFLPISQTPHHDNCPSI
jgi:hypothetical protein